MKKSRHANVDEGKKKARRLVVKKRDEEIVEAVKIYRKTKAGGTRR